MKATLLEAVLISAMVAGCSGVGTSSPPPTTPAVPEPAGEPAALPELDEEAEAEPPAERSWLDEHKAYVGVLRAAWDQHDAEVVMAAYAPAARIGMAGPGGWTELAPGEAKGSLQAMMTAFPDGKITPRRLISAGERAVLEWVFTGTNRGELMGDDPTDQPVGVVGASFLSFDAEGKVVRENRYLDLAAIQGQLGKLVRGGKVREVVTAPSAPMVIVEATRGEEPKSVTLLKKYYELTQKRDHQAIADLLADDAVICNNREAKDMTKADLVKLQPAVDRAFVDEGSVVKSCVNAGAIGACEYEWTATLKRPAMGMPATGKRGTIHEADVAEVTEGKLARVDGYGSRLEWLIAFGAIKPAPQQP